MTTEAESRQFEFKQAIIELLWNDDTSQAATRVVARCTSGEEREHALWMAVALQRAAAVNALMADPQRRTEMGKAARRRVVEHFSWRRIAEETIHFYRDLLDS